MSPPCLEPQGCQSGGLVNWCFEDYIGAEGDFHKRYIVERTNEAEIRQEEQSVKRESCRENLWNEIQLKVP